MVYVAVVNVLHELSYRHQYQSNLLITSSDVASLLRTDLQAEGSNGNSQQGEDGDVGRTGSTCICLDGVGVIAAAVAACAGARDVSGTGHIARARDAAGAGVVVANPDTVLPATSA